MSGHVRVRPARAQDAGPLAALYRANRAHLAPFEPTRDPEFFTEHGQATAGPDFADVQGDGDGDEVSIPVPGNDTVFVGAEDEPTLTLVDLGRSLRSSESLPVTFVFEQAGAVTVDAVIAAEGRHPRSDVDFPDPAEDPTGQG
jgi:hypothetical protein